MVFLISSTHDAILTVPLGSTVVGTMMGAWPARVALAVEWRSGVTPGSELGGEPRPADVRFTKAPQLIVPGSDGGVKVDTMRSTCLVALGLDAGESWAW